MVMSLAKSKSYPTLSCMWLPLGGYDVLLPKSMIKEVIYRPLVKIYTDSSDWLIGELDWQDYVMPLISFELLCNQPRDKKSTHARAVVCHTIEKSDAFPYYAIEVQSTPRPLILDCRALHNHEGMMNKHSEVISYHVKIGSKELAIPNIEKLEAILATGAAA